MNTDQELTNIIKQTIATIPIDLSQENIQNSVEDTFSIKFNLEQLLTAKLLIEKCNLLKCGCYD